jgi:hypothetical protein
LSAIAGGPVPLRADEYQRVPEIPDAIKARLNRAGTRPGLAVLTGSTRQDAQSLTQPVDCGPDLVVEFDDDQVLAFELRASERAAGPATAGLRELRDLRGDCFIAGVVLTTGRRSYTCEDRIHVMPLDRLWRPVG